MTTNLVAVYVEAARRQHQNETMKEGAGLFAVVAVGIVALGLIHAAGLLPALVLALKAVGVLILILPFACVLLLIYFSVTKT